jgi:hypothetical protein
MYEESEDQFYNKIKNNIIHSKNFLKFNLAENLECINLKCINLIGPEYNTYTPDSWIYEIIKILFHEFEFKHNIIIPNADFIIPYYQYEFSEIPTVSLDLNSYINEYNNKFNNLFYIKLDSNDYNQNSFLELFYKLGFYKNKYIFIDPDVSNLEFINDMKQYDPNIQYISDCLLDVCKAIVNDTN